MFMVSPSMTSETRSDFWINWYKRRACRMTAFFDIPFSSASCVSTLASFSGRFKVYENLSAISLPALLYSSAGNIARVCNADAGPKIVLIVCPFDTAPEMPERVLLDSIALFEAF
jgi:hypothetical protein